MTEETRAQMIEAAGWALCADAGGGGKGRCDLDECCCGKEAAVAVEAAIRAALAAQQDGAREAANVFRRAVVEAGLADRRGDGAEAFRLRAVALAIEEAYPDAAALAYREAGVHAVEQNRGT